VAAWLAAWGWLAGPPPKVLLKFSICGGLESQSSVLALVGSTAGGLGWGWLLGWLPGWGWGCRPSSLSFAKVFYLWLIGVAKFGSSFSRKHGWRPGLGVAGCGWGWWAGPPPNVLLKFSICGQIWVAKFRSSFSRRTLVDWGRLPVVGCLARAAWLGVAAWLGLATCLGLAAWLGLPDWG
jgi:hypothetical protein